MKISSNKNLGYTTSILASVILGCEGVYVRNIHVDEFIITIARLGIGLIFIALYLLIRNQFPKIKFKDISFSLIISGLLLGLIMFFYMQAINLIPLSSAVFLLYLGPIIAVGISSLIIKEPATKLNFILIALAFIGFLCLLEFKLSFDLSKSKGVLLGAAAGLCYALYIVLNRRIPNNIDSMHRSFYQFLFGLFILVPFIFTVDSFSITTKDIFLLTGMSFTQGFLAFTFIIVAIKYLKAVEYGTISYLEPLVATLIGFLIYSEQLSTLQSFGCAIIFIGGLTQIVTTKDKL